MPQLMRSNTQNVIPIPKPNKIQCTYSFDVLEVLFILNLFSTQVSPDSLNNCVHSQDHQIHHYQHQHYQQQLPVIQFLNKQTNMQTIANILYVTFSLIRLQRSYYEATRNVCFFVVK